MDAVKRAELVADSGLVGDANRGGWRQVTLIEAEVWRALVAELGTEVPPAARRANVLLSGVALAYTRGRVLRLGECRLRIGGETAPCEVMDKALPGLQAAMRRIDWGGGAFAQVLTGGELRVGDGAAWEAPEMKP